MQTISLLRLKKDLRVHDHAPLHHARAAGHPVIAFFCFEPSIMSQPDWSTFHGQCLKESLLDLQHSLQQLHIPLLIFRREVDDVLDLIQQHYQIATIYAHEETGNLATYARDKTIIRYAQDHHITLHESPTNGVIRRLSSRDNRQAQRRKRLEVPLIAVPDPQTPITIHDDITCQTITLPTRRRHADLRPCGESIAHQRMDVFLRQHVDQYLYHIGKPLESTQSCGRFSTHLTYGNLSLKQLLIRSYDYAHALREQKNTHPKDSPAHIQAKKTLRHLNGFIARLHWHDHFVQKLESDTRYETDNIHPYYDRIRLERSETYLQARKEWRTGYPLIDAAMRCLQQTGWINFRLRATLLSFICNTCMQDRREPALHLARLFADYEPGIHYTQCQMQAGTTGINQYRIYNPTKQLLEKDSLGRFVDKWVPELRALPMPLKAQPRTMSGGLFGWAYGVTIGQDYPAPIIDMEEANRKAKDILRDLKKQPWFRTIAERIYQAHGSRKKKS